MSAVNPLADNDRTDQDDGALVARAQEGDRQALEDLVRRHQAWIYNIASPRHRGHEGRCARDARPPVRRRLPAAPLLRVARPGAGT